MSSYRSIGRWALLTSIGVLVAACSAGPSVRQADPFGSGGSEEVLLTIHNNDYRDAVVYAYWNGFKERVGTVIGTTTHTFRMKWKGEWIQLAVDFIGSTGAQYSDRIGVTQGDHLDYVILGEAR